MEIAYDFSEIFSPEPIQRLDRAQLVRFNPRKFWAVQKAIDTLGHLSTEAQGLKRILTTYEKVLSQPEEQFIYLMWHRHPIKPIVIGMLKVGNKHLYLLDGTQQRYEEEPLCILDFYIHDSVQRRGNGHQLFDYMLRVRSVQQNLARRTCGRGSTHRCVLLVGAINVHVQNRANGKCAMVEGAPPRHSLRSVLLVLVVNHSFVLLLYENHY
ncbi:unnamed protein product [Haemonchus placei]|uniref:N-acetyltransferase domain-containing protein n=1 Tax=Haemonchus placei TaxID=6290 RepID=A0A0N4W9N9_HAEPC|nr:unnamed protein product [Haemonchus placei]